MKKPKYRILRPKEARQKEIEWAINERDKDPDDPYWADELKSEGEDPESEEYDVLHENLPTLIRKAIRLGIEKSDFRASMELWYAMLYIHKEDKDAFFEEVVRLKQIAAKKKMTAKKARLKQAMEKIPKDKKGS